MEGWDSNPNTEEQDRGAQLRSAWGVEGAGRNPPLQRASLDPEQGLAARALLPLEFSGPQFRPGIFYTSGNGNSVKSSFGQQPSFLVTM